MRALFQKKLDDILKMNTIISDSLGIHLTDVCLNNFVEDANFTLPYIKPSGPYQPRISIDDKNVISFIFHNIFDKMNSNFILNHDNVIMIKIFNETKNLMSVLDACRFKHYKSMQVLSVFDTIDLLFSVNNDLNNNEINLEIIIRNPLSGYPFISNNSVVCIARYLFTKFSLSGELLSSDLIGLKSKVFESWNLSEDILNVDYKNFGHLTEMIHF